MKGQVKNCGVCGKPFVKKRNKHSFCSSTCRVKNHRIKNGEPVIPSFISSPKSQSNKNPLFPFSIPTPKEYQTERQEASQPNSVNIEVKKNDGILWDLTIRRMQLIQTKERVINQRKSFMGPVGLGLGLYSGDNVGEKMFQGIILGIIGNAIDMSNARATNDLIQKLDSEIKEIERRIRQTKKVKGILESITKGKIGNKESEGVILDKSDIAMESKMGVIISSSDYKKQDIPTIEMKGKWKYLIGETGEGFFKMVTGLPGNGKSTYCVEFAQYFHENHGDVLYLASEQKGLNKSLQSLLRKFRTTFSIHSKPERSVRSILRDSKRYKMIVIDSVNHLGLDYLDIEELREVRPDLCIVGVMQSTKSGDYKGAQEFLHNCDIRVNMDKMIAYQTKSRYSPPAHLALEI